MKNQDLIAGVATGTITKDKTVNHLIYSASAATVYSYGYHYPLFFKLNNKWIVNDTGYSATTGKHIGYARQYAEGVVSLPNSGGGFFSQSLTIDKVKNEILRERNQIAEKLANLSTRAFRQKQILTDRDLLLEKTLKLLN